MLFFHFHTILYSCHISAHDKYTSHFNKPTLRRKCLGPVPQDYQMLQFKAYTVHPKGFTLWQTHRNSKLPWSNTFSIPWNSYLERRWVCVARRELLSWLLTGLKHSMAITVYWYCLCRSMHIHFIILIDWLVAHVMPPPTLNIFHLSPWNVYQVLQIV